MMKVGRRFAHVALMLTSVGAFAIAASPTMAQPQLRNFDIPAQALSSAILEFSRQADVLVMLPPEFAAGKRSFAVKGNLPVNVAIDQLLRSSGLRAIPNTTGGYRVGPFEAAKVSVSLPLRPPPVMETEVADAPAPESDELIVTGTRVTGLKASDSPAPIQIVGAELLRRTGQPDLIQALAQNLPSIQAQAAGGDQAALHLSVRLRGLSPNHTLVLINGKRRHSSSNVNVSGGTFGGAAAADIGLIPTDSIARVEVLQDGAAAQYGTDAIAGVVNFILKRTPSGGSLSTTAGEYIDGGGRTYQISGNLGTTPFSGAYLNITGERKHHGFSFRGDVDPRVIVTRSPSSTGAALLARFPSLANAPNYPYVSRVGGDAKYDQAAVTYNAGYEASPNLELYSFGTYSHKTARSNQTYRLPNVVLGKMVGDVPFPQGFTPQQVTRETDYAATLGASGSFGKLNFDLTSTYGRDNNRVYVENSSNASLYNANSTAISVGNSPRNFHNGDFTFSQWTNTLDLTRSIDVGMAGPLNIAGGLEFRYETYRIEAGDPASYFGTGSQSFFGYAPVNASKNSRKNFSQYLDLSVKPVDQLLIDAAVRHEHYSDFGSTTVFKLTSRYDFTDAFALRGTASTGFRAPTLAEAFYSGINISPTAIGGVFAPNSAGAKALGISGLKPEKSTNLSLGAVIHPVSALTVTLDAFSISVRDRIVQSGFFFGYNANPNVITSPSVLTALTTNGVTIDPNLFTLPGAAISVQSFVNGVSTRTRGIDLVATYSTNIENLGRVDWSINANYTGTRITRVSAPPTNVNQGVNLLDAAARAALVHTAPKVRATAGAYWTIGKFALNLRESFYSRSYALLMNPVTARFQPIPVTSKFITDIDLAYKLTRTLTLSAGANNLFNVYPNKIPASLKDAFLQVNSPTYALKYWRETPINWNGGYYYARATFRF